jgi:DNA-binding response OmpR family regulator
MRILLTEDDHRLSKRLVRVLTRENYIVDGAMDSEEALQLIETFPYDLLILDIILPGIDGITLCRKLRDRNFKIPILLLTAKNSNEDKVKAFDAGADDYLVKPFNLAELLARIRALLRRNSSEFITVLEWGDLCLVPSNRKVTYKNQKIHLTLTEYQILELFLRHPKRLFSCGDIIENLYFFDNPPTENTIRSHIRGLRKKLKNVGCINLIDTVHGFGYRLKLDKSRGDSEEKPVAYLKKKIEAALVKSWHEFKKSIFLDVAFLDRVAREFEKKSINNLPEAIRVAHNLVGILGSLGCYEAALISRDIENLLEEGNWEIDEKLTELRRLLEERSPQEITNKNSIISDGESFLEGKILVADDDPNFLSELQKTLNSTKLKIYTMTTSFNFWQTLEKVSPDLLILDLKMPHSIQLCQLLRKKPRYQTLPILFVSDNFNEDNLQELVVAGADDFTSKSALKGQLKYRVGCLMQRGKRLKLIDN